MYQIEDLEEDLKSAKQEYKDYKNPLHKPKDQRPLEDRKALELIFGPLQGRERTQVVAGLLDLIELVNEGFQFDDARPHKSGSYVTLLLSKRREQDGRH